MDLFAAEIGMDRAEIRRRNFIQPDQFPYENPSGLGTASGGAKIYIDSGNYEPAMDKALAMAGYGDLAAKKAEAKARGKLLGIGLSTYIEVCGVAPSKWIGAVGEGWGAAMWESANIKMHLTGKTVVTMGTQPQGQGHETTYSQIISHELGIPMADIVVQHSDTQGTPFGYGSYGSRTSSVGSTAAIKAAGKIREKARRMAAHMLEASADDIEIDGANYFVKGSPDRVKTIQEIAFAIDLAFDPPEGMEPYLDETAYYDTPNCTWPFGTHIATVEIDEETGHVELVRYLAVDDVGKKINPMIVDGQLHGGIAQGVGQALWEGAIYDDQGQLQTGSMMDYTVPRASFFPNIELDETVTPSPVNPIGVKGVGEAGRDREHGGGGQCGHRRSQRPRHPPSRHAVHAADRVARDPGFEGRPGVIPAAFAYQRPASIEEALAIIGSDPGAKLLAGGQSLLPLLKLRLGLGRDAGRHRPAAGPAWGPPARRRLAGDRRPDDVRRVARVARSRVRPAARRAAPHRRRPGPQPRDGRRLDRPCRSGLGPAGLPARARGRARHPVGRRRADDACQRVLRGRLHRPGSRPGEILTEIRIPGRRDDAASAYETLEQPASGYATVGVAAVVVLERFGRDRRGERRPDRCRRDGLPSQRRRGGTRRLGRIDGLDRRRRRARDRWGRGRVRHPRRSRLSHRDGRRLHPPCDRGRPRSAALIVRPSIRAGPTRHAGPARACAPGRGDPRP